MATDNLPAQVDEILMQEKSLSERLDALEKAHPDVFAEIKAIEVAHKEVDALKASIKKYLVERQDFDVHNEHPKVRVSVSKIAKVEVADIEKVPDQFKETKVVANEKKAQEYLRVMGEAPDGFKETSYYRLNWKLKEDA